MNRLIRTVNSIPWLSRQRKMALYPPFFLMGIKVLDISQQPIRIRLLLPLSWRSKNSGGSLFGGFQSAIADPIAPMACIMAFPDYHVWTRHLAVDFQAPGNSDLELRFEFDPKQLAAIKAELEERGRSTPTFEYGLYREDGVMCTAIRCTVAIREEGYKKP